jgi:hypothetical protein
MEKITDILFCEVETENGQELGRVFEIRSEGDPDHGLANSSRSIDYLLCGDVALLQRLGFREKDLTEVSTDRIKEFRDGKIIVSEEAADASDV